MKGTRGRTGVLRWTTQRTRTLVAAAAIAMAAACGGDSGNPAGLNPSSPPGTYDLSTINAKPVPVVIAADGDYKFEIVSSSVTLTADGKYSTKSVSRQTLAGRIDQFTDSTRGTWVQSGSSLTLTDAEDASVQKADWASGKLTFVVVELKASNTYVFTLRK